METKLRNFRLDPKTDERLNRLAAEGSTSRSAVLRVLVARADAELDEQEATRTRIRKELGLDEGRERELQVQL